MLRRLQRIAFRTVLVMVALLVVAEIAFRTIGFGNPVRYAFDKDCGYLPAPNQHARRFFAQNDINEFGMRSGSISAHKEPGTFRVLMLGDSVTYGTTYVDQSRIFTTLLQKQLPSVMNRKVEVLNVSAGGWGVGNEVGYLKSRGTFEADLVIMVLNTSDPIQNTAAISYGDLNYPTEKPMLAVTEAFNRYLMPRISARVASMLQADAGSQAAKTDSLDDEPLIRGRILEAQAFAHARGAGFAMAFIPFRHADANLPVYKAAAQNFKAWCRDTGMPLVDTTEDMEKYPAHVTHIDGAHMRPEGHMIVAAKFQREWTSLLIAAAPDAAGSHSHQLAVAHNLERE